MQNYSDNLFSFLLPFNHSVKMNDKLVEILKFLMYFMKMCPTQLKEKKQLSFCRYPGAYVGGELHQLI